MFSFDRWVFDVEDNFKSKIELATWKTDWWNAIQVRKSKDVYHISINSFALSVGELYHNMILLHYWKYYDITIGLPSFPYDVIYFTQNATNIYQCHGLQTNNIQ